MTNGEKYVTAKERAEAFLRWCESGQRPPCGNKKCKECQFSWIDLEVEEEKPLPCPFCGSPVEFDDNCNVFNCTSCNYMSSGPLMNESAIAAHNRVAKKCREGNE